MAKSVRVHDDTHKALKHIKAQRRAKSIDQVIREMIRSSTGNPVNEERARSETKELTSFLEA